MKFDYTIESAFYHTSDDLELCAKNGIVLNSKISILLWHYHICWAHNHPHRYHTITKTPWCHQKLSNIHRHHWSFLWFGLVNQASWAYSISPIMQLFVKPNMKFHWDSTLEQLFWNSKELILSAVTEGIQLFNPTRPTCLQTDWSKTSIGYLLLQKYCQCETSTTPIYCHDGWRIVYAGSCFTSETESQYSPTEGELAVDGHLNMLVYLYWMPVLNSNNQSPTNLWNFLWSWPGNNS